MRKYKNEELKQSSVWITENIIHAIEVAAGRNRKS